MLRAKGKGVDIILDCVGAPYVEKNMKSLATDGKIVYIGWMGGGSNMELYHSSLLHL